MLSRAEEIALKRERALAIEIDLRGGMKAKDAAEKYGMSPAYVSRIILQCGCGPRQLNRAKHAALAVDYANGTPLKTIAEKHGVNRRAIWVACENNNVPLRRATVRSKARTC